MVVAFVLSVFAARLVQLQGVDASDYAKLAAEKGAETITLEAPRASILDRNGVALAETIDASMITADPTMTAKDATAIAALLHDKLGVDYLDTVEKLRKEGTRYVEVARHVAPEVAQQTVSELADAKYPGLYVRKDSLRVYPAGDVAANLLGFVGGNTGPKDRGMGLEYSLNDLLAGKDGKATVTMSGGQQLPLSVSTITKPVEGTSVQLTLDSDLQFLAQRRLAEAVKESGGKSGMVVMMDVRTGQLLALADYPSFDPNDFIDEDPEDFGSAALQNVYEPGSVEKVLTFSALIDAGYVTPRTHIVVPSTLPRGGHTIHDYFSHPTLHLTATGVVAKSSNIGTVLAAEQMPKVALYNYLRKFGFGSQTNIGVAGESAGLLPDGHDWLDINRDTIAFGQGLSINAVQMASAIATIANGGLRVAPSLIDGYRDSDGNFTPADAPDQRRVISRATAAKVGLMMEAVTGPEGTAPSAAIPGYRVAGKTGTAQRVSESCACYDGSFTVSFAGFAPADNPRFVVYVVVHQPTNGDGGGTTGGPVFHDLLEAALVKYGVPPTGTRAPRVPVDW